MEKIPKKSVPLYHGLETTVSILADFPLSNLMGITCYFCLMEQ